MVQSGFWQITLMYVVLQFSVSYSRPSASYLCKPFTWDVSGSVGSSLASKLLPFAVSSLLLAVCAGDRRGQLVIEHFHLGPIAYAVAYLYVMMPCCDVHTAPCSLRIKDAWHYNLRGLLVAPL